MSRNLITRFDADITSFNQKIQNMQRQVNNLSQSFRSAEQATSNMKQAEQQFEQQNQKIQQTNNTLDQHEQKINKSSNAIKKQNKATQEANKSTENWMSSYTESLGIAIRSTALWAGATTAIYGTKRAMEEMHSVMIDVNTEMIALQRVMDEVMTDFNEMEESATNMAINFAKNVDEVVASMVQWGRQGKNQIEVIELTEAALLATNVAQMEAVQAVDLLTSAILQFQMEAAEATEIVDRLNEVANNYATTATDLAMSIRESGAAAYNAGISMDELIGITTSLAAATAKSGNRIGRALRTVFSRMMGDMQDSGEALGQVEHMLNSIGVAIRQTETEYRDMTNVLTDLAIKWHEIDEVMQANIARALGGRRRYSDVISLMENWDMALDATESSLTSLNSAMEENEIYMDSMQAHWNQARAQFESLSLTLKELGTETLSKNMANALQGFYRKLENFLVGIREIDNRIIILVSSIGILTTAMIKLEAIIKAVTAAKKKFLLVMNPVRAAVVAVSAATLIGIERWGNYQQVLSEVEETQEQLNEVKERGNELSLEEVNRVDDTISEYQNLIDTYIATANVIEEEGMSDFLLEGMHWEGLKFDVPIISGIEEAFTKGLSRMVGASDDFVDSVREQEEVVDNLRTEHQDLSSQYDDDVDFMNALIVSMDNYQNHLESTVSWINKYTMELYESTQQSARENQMLQQKIDRYNELASQTERTVAEEAELRDIIYDLQESFPELAAAGDDFGATLSDLGERKMAKFGQSGSEINNTIREMEQGLIDLDESQVILEKQLEKTAQNISALEGELEEVHPEKNAMKWSELSNSLHQSEQRYLNIIEKMRLTDELRGELEAGIESLQGEFDDFDTKEFLSNIKEVNTIFNDIKNEILDIEAQLNDLDLAFDRRIQLSNIIGELEDFTDIEKFGAMQDAVSDTQDDILNMIENLIDLDLSAESDVLKRQIEEIIGEVEYLEGVDASPDALIEDWDLEGLDELRTELINRLQEEYYAIEEEVTGLDVVISITELLEYEDIDISELDDSDLIEIQEQIEKTVNEWSEVEDIHDVLFEKVSDDAKDFFNQILSDMDNTHSSLIDIGENLNFWHELTKEKSYRSIKEELVEIDDYLGQIIDREFYDEPILTDDAQKNVEILKSSITDMMNILTDKDLNLLEEKDLESLKDFENELQELIKGIKYYSDTTDEVVFDEFIDEDEIEQQIENIINEIENIEREIELDEAIEFIDEKSLRLLSDYEQQINNIKKDKVKLKEIKAIEGLDDEQLAVVNELVKDLKKEIDELEEQEEFKDLNNDLQELESILANIIGISDWEKEGFLTGNISDDVNILEENINAMVENIDKIDVDDNIIDNAFVDLTEEQQEELKSVYEEVESYIEEIIDRYDYIDHELEEINLADFIKKDQLKDISDEVKKELLDIEDSFEKIELEEKISDIVTDHQFAQLDDLDKEIYNTQNTIEEYGEKLKTASNKGANNTEELRAIIKELEDDLDNLKEESKNIEMFEELFDDDKVNLDKVASSLDDINISEIIGIKEAEGTIELLEVYLATFAADMELLSNKFERDFISEQLAEMGIELDEEEMEELIEELNDYIQDTSFAWANAIAEGVSMAFNDIETTESIATTLNNITRNVLSNVLAFEEGEQQIQKMVDNLAKGIRSTLDTEIGDELETSIMLSIDAYAQGENIGTSLLQGIGYAVGGGAGAGIGTAIGKLTEVIFGGPKDVERAEDAKQINEQIKQLSNELSDLGMHFDDIYADVDNTATIVERLFGRDVWEVDNLEAAKDQLQEMENVLSRIERFASQALSGIGNAITDSLNYWDFRMNFEQTIGQALQDAIIEQLLHSHQIEQAVEQIAVMAEGIITDTGDIDEIAIQRLENEIETVLDQSDELRQIWNEIAGEISVLDTPDVDARQTFRAGQTTSLTVRNTYTVQALAFGGNRTEARRFAEMMEPHIREVNERYMGR